MNNQNILRVAEGARLVAKAAISLTGSDTVHTSSSICRHFLDLLLQGKNVTKFQQMEKNITIHQDFVKTPNINHLQSNTHLEPTTDSLQVKTVNVNNEQSPSMTPPTHWTQSISSNNDGHNLSPSHLNISIESTENLSRRIASTNESTLNSSSPSLQDTSIPTYSHIQEGRPVPSTRIGRAVGFASLGVGLFTGTALEYASRWIQSQNSQESSLVFNSSNSDRLAKTLCRMRGAALKLGQLLSIQDQDSLSLPTPLSHALQQVRQNAEAMPLYQLRQQLKNEWKGQYNIKEQIHEGLQSMDALPFAAASIGQVHRGLLKESFAQDGSYPSRHVVIKVQYPGVAESIESDLANLQMLISMTGLAPKGLFLDNIIRVGRQELKVECDYIREATNQKRFKEWVEQDDELQRQRFRVPNVIDAMSTQKILTSEFCPGSTIDLVSSQCDASERNRIGRAILYLTMKELFCWRFMQTDPNWGNFLYDPKSKITYLIDFGAAREYSKRFVDGYLRIVWASANRDEETLMEQSYRMGFLTGKESSIMMEAHRQSAYIIGEPFSSDSVYHFASSGITHRISEHGSVFLHHRLTPPPEEVYTLHRKLAGTFNLCIKLGANIKCRDLLVDILKNHEFDDGIEHPLALSH